MIQIVAARVFPGAEKPVFVYTQPSLLVANLSAVFKDFHSVLEKLQPDERYNLFYTLGHHSGAGSGEKPQRLKTTFEHQSHIHFDIDQADSQRAHEYSAVVAKVVQAPSEASTLVGSGHGIHVLYALRHPARSSKYFDENREAYKELIRLINEELEKQHLPGYADPNVFDASRVLRLPGTENRKPGLPVKQCVLIQQSDLMLDIDLKKVSGLEAREKERISPTERRRSYPAPDFQELVKECHFVRWAIAKPEELHEPQAFDLCSTLAACPSDAKSTLAGAEYSPKELAELVLSKATKSASLKRQGFEQKWEQAETYGAPKCTTIHNKWIGGCERCPHWGKIPTPLALRSPHFISSTNNGYWVFGAKGPLHPHYEDLSRVYKIQQPYIVTEESRILGFQATHYKEVPDLRVKAWIDGILVPTEHIRETHRVEFLNRIRSTQALNGMADTEFFTESIKGKLNCSNAVLDIPSGKILPHSPDYGFLYKLPYDINLEHTGSEFFLDWLSTVTADRPELMESILDIMAYALWPSYDDHMFAYFIGEGANGKSTLIHVIQALVGKDNYSTASIQQLGTNRFAPAQLEGKLVNLSEESSGGGEEISFEAMNTIKALSAGDDLLVERKGQDGFTFRNKAKLIFSANQSPRFKETGHAIQRRMLVIPFEHKIKAPDPRVETQLLAEVPKIMVMLVKRIQENITRNGGRFIVHRGGGVSEEAKTRVLAGYGSAYEWAKECIESRVDLGVEAYIGVDEAYQHYKVWCDRNGYSKPAAKPSFGRTMCDIIITKAARGSQTVSISNKSFRVYTHTRYKEGMTS